MERCRADPNLLVITYTSEHNHPWPTQRNALAGSTRSQPSKNNAAASKSNPQKPTSPKEEQKESSNEGNVSPSTAAAAGGSTTSSSACVKEEIEDIEKQLEMEDGEFSASEGFPYRPAMPGSNQSDQDFFADLGEIEADPLDLLFTQGFSVSGDHDHTQKDNKAMDPFSLFDWSGESNSFGETNKRGL